MTAIEEKKEAIATIQDAQNRLIKKVKAIQKLKPAKRPHTYYKRAIQVRDIMYQVCQLEAQKQIIISKPVPKFPKGGIYKGGLAVIGETGPEIINPVSPQYQ